MEQNRSRIARIVKRAEAIIMVGMLSAMASADDTSFDTKNDPELASLLSRVAKNPEDVGRNASGNVVSLALRNTNANDRALFLISNVSSLQELLIQGGGRPETVQWTGEGISSLGKLTNLVALRVICVAPRPALKPAAFEEICKLKSLRSLTLVAAYPERSEYAALTNLQNLVELDISYATNFGDTELSLITNMPKLRNIRLSYDAISRQGTNVFRNMPGLTNTILHLQRTQP